MFVCTSVGTIVVIAFINSADSEDDDWVELEVARCSARMSLMFVERSSAPVSV